jgi:hypothetical protein
MKPQLAISACVTSEKRAAAARANGAKSRGPVTAQGRANSSRNSFRHGLRSQTLFADRESADHLTALLASFEGEFQPQSEIEHTLIGAMALTWWRQSCLWKLETALLNREVLRLKSITPGESPATLLALAFRSLSDHGCALDIISRIESRCHRQYFRAIDRLAEVRVRRAHYAGAGIPEKVNIYERTQQVTENTAPHFGTTQETSSNELRARQSQPVGNPNPKKVIVDERTQQAPENTPSCIGPTAESDVLRAAASAPN